MMSTNGELSSSLNDFSQKKSALLSKMSATSASTNNCFSTSSSEKMLKSSSSSTSVTSSKKAQIRHAMTSSSTSCQELKQQQQQQNEIFQQENRNFSRSVSVTSNASTSSDSRLKLLSSSGFSMDDDLSKNQALQEKVTFGQSQQQKVTSSSSSTSKVKMNSTSTTAEGYTEEKMAAINQERKQVRSGSISYEESSTTSALQHKLEADGFKTEKIAALRQDQRQLKTPDSLQQQQRTAMAASMKLSTDEFTAEKIAMAKQEEMRSFSSHGMVQSEKNMSSSSSSKVTFTSKNNISKSAICSQNLHQIDFGEMSTSDLGMMSLTNSEPFSSIQNKNVDITNGLDQDVEFLSKCSVSGPEVDKVIQKFSCRMNSCIEKLKLASEDEAILLLGTMSKILESVWAVPTYGHDLGSTMCKLIADSGTLGILIDNCVSTNFDLQFHSAKVLQLCLSTENRTYVVDNGLEQVVKVACICSAKCSPFQSRVGTGLLEHLFKHSEATCSDVIRMGGLTSILFKCRCSDVETLRHCASALANLSLYGGPENQQAMIKNKVPVWLFPLAFQKNDDHIKYYACLAISALVTNKEIEAAVIKSGTFDLVESFVPTHSPAEFAKSHVAHVHGQSKNWLQRLINVLDSNREEARNLAAFHFAMEAGIKKKQGNTELFHEIGAVEALKKVASSPNAVASKFAAQALQLIGEVVPHKLSQQVPLWTAEDVREWVKQIGFSNYCTEFANSRVDGDLLLQLTEEMLKDDIGINNGILRKRFLRELNQLKKMADYTSVDSTYLNQILLNLGAEFCQYTYQMLHCGVQKDTLKYLTEEQLARDCGVENSIHRLRITHAIQGMAQESENAEENEESKPLDVFISYRRSNGSQLASLLKVHLQLKGFTVFIDVERLEAGKFDNNLLQSIRQAKHFILVLTIDALERCVEDNECKDWVHKEIVQALQSQCNIIPILDQNFDWPTPETLPEDMRAVSYFNGVRWVHDYQDACVEKIERFIRGEMNVRNEGKYSNISGAGAGTPGIIHGAGTPVIGVPPIVKNQQPIYQRSTSNDSNKDTNEKECCNGPINGTG